MALGALRVLCANNKIEMGSVFVHGEDAFQQGNSTGAAMNNLISQRKKLSRVLARDSYIIRRSKKRSHPFFSAFYPIPGPASSFDRSGGGDSAASEKRHHDYLREQLKDYTGMPVQDKIKIISNMLKAMFQDQDRADERFEMKLYQDILANKLALIFSLLSIR